MDIRLPAEWEEQDGVLLAWPHHDTDWSETLDDVLPVFIELARQISRFEKVLIVTPDTEGVKKTLLAAGLNLSSIIICHVPTNDTWTRDYGPITILANGIPVMLDFGFNGWGLKFAADLDNNVTRLLKQQGALAPALKTIGLVLEGGSIESDGNGTILTTSRCLLSPNRNPQLAKDEIEGALNALLGAQHVHWLYHGELAGDDTDAHIDTLARFCPNDTLVYVGCSDPDDPHAEPLRMMENELQALKTRQGTPYRLIALPWPAPVFDSAGARMPATYANFLVINRAVLVPTYRDQSDNTALAMMALAFPDHEIIGIDCVPLIMQHGSLHCVTMQLPKGTLS